MPYWQKIRIGVFAGILVAVGVLYLVSGGHPHALMNQLFGL